MLDIAFMGGLVLDGTGNKPRQNDVGIKDQEAPYYPKSSPLSQGRWRPRNAADLVVFEPENISAPEDYKNND